MEDDREKISVVYLIIVGLMLLISIAIPPIMLLNLPILFLRSAYFYWKENRRNQKEESDTHENNQPS